MTITELISAIQQKHKDSGITINLPASIEEIQTFESRFDFKLPIDFKEFYSICNGFECTEDIFRVIPLKEIVEDERHYGENWFHFAEYMIFSDMWTLRKKSNDKYEIFNIGSVEVVLTSFLQEFLERFLEGNVFENGGLYSWHDELKQI